jgi:hypothetical protein
MTASQRLGSIIDHLFSPRNLKYARAFAEAWAEEEFVQAPLAQIGVQAASVQKFTLRDLPIFKSNVFSAP